MLFRSQFAISGSVPFGVGQTSTSAQLSEPNGAVLSAFRSETLTAYGDFSPTLTLKWALGPHNFMGYVTANVPTGYYSPSNIASLGLGRWAIDQGFDIVVLVHGDGQYAPEFLPEIVKPLEQGEADAVFGSRMMTPGGA